MAVAEPGSRRSHRFPRYLARRARVRAAFCAALERVAAPFVRAALRAKADRADGERLAGALLAWSANALWEAALRGSCCNTLATARETRGRRWACRLPCPTSC